jgi:hypothetical protein
MSRWKAPLVAVTTCACLAVVAGCGDEAGPQASPAAFDFDGERVAPPAGQGYGVEGSETDPDPEWSVAELELDSGAVVVLWVGEDSRSVYQQHADPDDPDAWTEPELLFESGDGCSGIEADTNGETVAATLECYGSDLFIQQAPDEGQAVVTQDLAEWEVHDGGELYGAPVVADDGDDVTWEEDDLTWSAADGFSR